MNKMLSAAAMLAVATVPSAAEMRYDRNLEKAAMAIVASRIGDIRGGFSYKQKPQFVVRQDEVPRVGTKPPRRSVDAMVEGAPPQAGQRSSITRF
jgi:hypothetical protein